MSKLSIYKVTINSKEWFQGQHNNDVRKNPDLGYEFSIHNSWTYFLFLLDRLSKNDDFKSLGLEPNVFMMSEDAYVTLTNLLEWVDIWSDLIVKSEQFFAVSIIEDAEPIVHKTISRFSTMEANGFFWLDGSSLEDVEYLLKEHSGYSSDIKVDDEYDPSPSTEEFLQEESSEDEESVWIEDGSESSEDVGEVELSESLSETTEEEGNENGDKSVESETTNEGDESVDWDEFLDESIKTMDSYLEEENGDSEAVSDSDSESVETFEDSNTGEEVETEQGDSEGVDSSLLTEEDTEGTGELGFTEGDLE